MDEKERRKGGMNERERNEKVGRDGGRVEGRGKGEEARRDKSKRGEEEDGRREEG